MPKFNAFAFRAPCVFNYFGPAGLARELLVDPVGIFVHCVAEIGDICADDFDSSNRELEPAEDLFKSFAEVLIGMGFSVPDLGGCYCNGLVVFMNEKGDAMLDRCNLVISLPGPVCCDPRAGRGTWFGEFDEKPRLMICGGADWGRLLPGTAMTCIFSRSTWVPRGIVAGGA